MKNTRIVLIICLVVVMAFVIASAALAAGDVVFIGINDSLVSLSDSTIPHYSRGFLYVPLSVIDSSGLGIYSESISDNVVSLTNGSSTLLLDKSTGDCYNEQDVYYSYTCEYQNGILYVPISFICSYFDIIQTIISADPGSMVRLKVSGGYVLSDKLFLSSRNSQMSSAYYAYFGRPVEPTVSPSPIPSEEKKETYENVTISISFTGLEGADEIVDDLNSYGYYSCFFADADEIRENQNTVRRILGNGDLIGIHVHSDPEAEYFAAKSVLYEISSQTAFMLFADSDCYDAAAEFCERAGLILFSASRRFYAPDSLREVTDSLYKESGSYQTIIFESSTSGFVIPRLMDHLIEYRYSTRRLDEITASR